MIRIAVRSLSKLAEKENASAAVKNIIRFSLTEFDRGLEQYKEFRKTNDTPDWGVVRLSSIAMVQDRHFEAERILKEQLDESGGKSRQARHVEVSEEQICAAIRRVLKKDLSAAFQFYDLLISNRFCTNRDVFVSILVQKLVETESWEAGIAKLEKILQKSGNRTNVKSLKMSVYWILEEANRKNQLEKAELEVSNRKFVKLPTLRGIKILVKLDSDTVLNVADFLKRNNITFSHEDVRLTVEMAGKIKSTRALQNLLDIDCFVRIPSNSHYLVFDELIKVAGKAEQLEVLERLISTVKSSKNLENDQQYTLYSKIRHFYKCLNVKTPKELYILLDRTSIVD